MANSMALGGGGRFAALKEKIAARGNVRDPGAVAAAIGRRKYGAAKMADMAAAGRAASHMPKGASLSPKGDLSQHRTAEGASAIRKSAMGKAERASSYLPYRAPETAIDPKFGPGDRVC